MTTSCVGALTGDPEALPAATLRLLPGNSDTHVPSAGAGAGTTPRACAKGTLAQPTSAGSLARNDRRSPVRPRGAGAAGVAKVDEPACHPREHAGGA